MYKLRIFNLKTQKKKGGWKAPSASNDGNLNERMNAISTFTLGT